MSFSYYLPRTPPISALLIYLQYNYPGGIIVLRTFKNCSYLRSNIKNIENARFLHDLKYRAYYDDSQIHKTNYPGRDKVIPGSCGRSKNRTYYDDRRTIFGPGITLSHPDVNLVLTGLVL